MTWNTAPAADTTLLASLGAVSVNTWYEVDITSLITGDGTYSLRISDSIGGADYYSKEGSNPPELVLTLGGTPAPTNTPTPGPSPTPTKTPTPSATPVATNTPTATAPAAFSSAAFVYDGDGKRVKSTFNGTVTTYFVGNHYEVANGVVTKYYYANTQRIALRTNGALNFLIGDHLGSASLTTSATGTVISELRYKAWGEERFASGSTATNYTYTGQYSYADDFGLMYYGARWYDPSIGRFNQPDTGIPGNQGVQAWDRYAYVNNNPLLYTDPSGRWIETAFDLLSLGMTLNDIRNEGFTTMNAISLVTDVVSVVLPIVPAGVSHAIRAAKYASKLANAADTAADTIKTVDKVMDASNKLSDYAKMVGDVCSFSADTQVSTQDGSENISAIEIGDHVLAWNEADGTLGYYEVTATLSHADKVLTELIIDGEWIETTPEHPFYSLEEGWLPADELKPGMYIRQANGDYELVWLKWTVYRTQEMYNLTVDTAHTFFVGEGQWLVHNECPILGKIQRNTSPEHQELQQKMAEKLANSGKYEVVWMDTAVRISTKGEVPSRREPDVLGLNFTDKIAHIIEISSQHQRSGPGRYTRDFLQTIGWTKSDFGRQNWHVISEILDDW